LSINENKHILAIKLFELKVLVFGILEKGSKSIIRNSKF